MKLAIAIALVAVSCTPVKGATMRMYTPGGAPCAGACGLEWATQQAGVPMGVPTRMVAPAGSYVNWMSYAKNGVPYGGSDSAVLANDEAGEGYWFERDGQAYLMFKLDACQNWAIIAPVPTALAVPAPYIVPVGGYGYDGYGGSPWWGVPFGFWGGGYDDYWDDEDDDTPYVPPYVPPDRPICTDCGVNPEVIIPPAPVPLPSGIWMLLAGLALLLKLKPRN